MDKKRTNFPKNKKPKKREKNNKKNNIKENKKLEIFKINDYILNNITDISNVLFSLKYIGLKDIFSTTLNRKLGELFDHYKVEKIKLKEESEPELFNRIKSLKTNGEYFSSNPYVYYKIERNDGENRSDTKENKSDTKENKSNDDDKNAEDDRDFNFNTRGAIISKNVPSFYLGLGVLKQIYDFILGYISSIKDFIKNIVSKLYTFTQNNIKSILPPLNIKYLFVLSLIGISSFAIYQLYFRRYISKEDEYYLKLNEKMENRKLIRPYLNNILKNKVNKYLIDKEPKRFYLIKYLVNICDEYDKININTNYKNNLNETAIFIYFVIDKLNTILTTSSVSKIKSNNLEIISFCLFNNVDLNEMEIMTFEWKDKKVKTKTGDKEAKDAFKYINTFFYENYNTFIKDLKYDKNNTYNKYNAYLNKIIKYIENGSNLIIDYINYNYSEYIIKKIKQLKENGDIKDNYLVFGSEKKISVVNEYNDINFITKDEFNINIFKILNFRKDYALFESNRIYNICAYKNNYGKNYNPTLIINLFTILLENNYIFDRLKSEASFEDEDEDDKDKYNMNLNDYDYDYKNKSKKLRKETYPKVIEIIQIITYILKTNNPIHYQFFNYIPNMSEEEKFDINTVTEYQALRSQEKYQILEQTVKYLTEFYLNIMVHYLDKKSNEDDFTTSFKNWINVWIIEFDVEEGYQASMFESDVNETKYINDAYNQLLNISIFEKLNKMRLGNFAKNKKYEEIILKKYVE